MTDAVTHDLRVAYDRKAAERDRSGKEPWKLEQRAQFAALLQAVGSAVEIAECLVGLAGALVADGAVVRAARLWGAAEVQHRAHGATVPPEVQTAYDHDLGAVRAQLDVGAWEAALAEGRAMTLEQAVAYALDEGAGAEQ